MLICAKVQGRRPSNEFKQGKTPQSCDPYSAHGLPREGGGERPQSRGGRPLGVPDPFLALLSPSFDRRWHGSMLRWWEPVLAPGIASSTA
jgi:hypothetical protein